MNRTASVSRWEKWFSILAALMICAGMGATQASAQISTANNNFTMIDVGGGLVGGTNDVAFTWDGTSKTAVAASGQVSNATLSSTCPFFGLTWSAHDLAIYGPGTYTVYDGCASGAPGCGTGNAVSFSVGADELAAHMLFDWGPSANIDVIDVWAPNAVFGPSPMWTIACGSNPADKVWDNMSKDWDGDGFNGAGMTDGPFMGFNANFNVMGVAVDPCDGVDCSDGNICTDDVCTAGVCSNPNNTAACDDGDACTTSDVCALGACMPGTAVVCPDDGNICTTEACVPATGMCVATNNNNICDDGNACTTGDACSGGSCGGTAVNCDDGNVCTDDSCDTATGCVNANNTAACDDGAFCNGTDTCSAGACVSSGDPCVAPAVCDEGTDTCVTPACTPPAAGTCDDGNVCTDDSVDTTALGGICPCVNTNNTAACDDGDLCTVGDACSGGSCVSGAAMDCSDGMTCTDDICTAGVCSNPENCVTPETCNAAGDCEIPGCTPQNCDDGNVCTDDSNDVNSNPGGVCDCINTNNTAACDDGAFCNGTDTCSGGACVSSGDPCVAPEVCDEATDTCVIVGGCQVPADCDDNNPCTRDRCPDGTCRNNPIAECCNTNAECPDDGKTCTDAVCADNVCTNPTNCVAPEYCNPAGECEVSTLPSGPVTGRLRVEDGSYFCMNSPYPQGICIPLEAGSDRGVVLGSHQPSALSPAVCGQNSYGFDPCTGGPGSIAAPFSFFGSGTYVSTNPVSWQSCATHDAPYAEAGADLGTGCVALKADLAGWEVFWNGNTFEQGPRVQPGVNVFATGQLCSDNSYELDWPAKIVGGAFNGVTGFWRLRGNLETCHDTVCNDDNPCTNDSFDLATCSCVFAETVVCDDGNECTDDTCDPTVCGGCVNTPNTATCTPDLCHTGSTCSNEECGTVIACDDGNACTADSCNPATGACKYTNQTFALCNDGNACTTDACVPATGECTYTNNTANCTGSDPCMNGDKCSGGVCVDGTTAKVCNDDNPCTDDSCNEFGGCSYVANSASCTPEDPLCNIGTTCADKVCGTPISCDDGDSCTTDTCEAGVCTSTVKADGASCDDSDACMVGETCSGGVCGKPYERNCSDWNACTDDTCDMVTGCEHTDTNCDDSNVCTDDSCDPLTGCDHINNMATCDDGDACTSGDTCSNGDCSGSAIVCDDGNVCTTDSCNPATGCVFTNNSAACDDGNICTSGDVCSGGACNGVTISCDDGNSCTADSCDTAAGCVNAVVPNGTFCPDVPNGMCHEGTCVSIVCDIQNATIKGGGQKASVDAQIQTTFTVTNVSAGGCIISYTKRSIQVAPGTDLKVDWLGSSPAVSSAELNGSPVPVGSILPINNVTSTNKVILTNKGLGGRDTDRISIRN